MGTGAATLGLEGEADGEAFGALIAGRDPSSGEVLRAGSGRDRVCALDLTFSAPKSVSVLFAIGDAETSRALVEAHEEAVGAAVGYLEREACRVRRGRGGRIELAADGFVAAALPASDEPGGPAAAAYPRGRGQSCSRLGRAVVGTAWVSDLPARQGRWLAVSGPPAGGRPRAPAVGGVGAGAQRDGRARRRAARRARALLAPAGGDPRMAGGRGAVGPAVGGEGRAGHARAEGRPGGAGAVVRAGAGRGGRARVWPRRAGRTDPRSSVPRPDRSTSTGSGAMLAGPAGPDRAAQQLRAAARGGRSRRGPSGRRAERGGRAGGRTVPGARRRRGHCDASGERRYTTASLLACERRIVDDAMRGQASGTALSPRRSSTGRSARCPRG